MFAFRSVVALEITVFVVRGHFPYFWSDSGIVPSSIGGILSDALTFFPRSPQIVFVWRQVFLWWSLKFNRCWCQFSVKICIVCSTDRILGCSLCFPSNDFFLVPFLEKWVCVLEILTNRLHRPSIWRSVWRTTWSFPLSGHNHMVRHLSFSFSGYVYWYLFRRQWNDQCCLVG